jgi:hypothetical protein
MPKNPKHAPKGKRGRPSARVPESTVRAARGHLAQQQALERLADGEMLSTLDWCALQQYLVANRHTAWGLQRAVLEMLRSAGLKSSRDTVGGVLSGQAHPTTTPRQQVVRVAIAIVASRLIAPDSNPPTP